MTKETAYQFVPLVKALADGKTIQFNNNGEWKDMAGDSIAFGNYREHYRIKPEPREWQLYLSNNGTVIHNALIGGIYPSFEAVDEVVTVREVLDETK